MRIALLLLSLVLTTPAAAQKPAEIARKFFDAQLAALSKGDDAAMKATFAADAIVLGTFDESEPIVNMPSGFQDALMSGSPHDTFKKAATKSFVAGGNDQMQWFTAEIEATFDNHEPESRPTKNNKRITRITAVIAGNKAIAAVFDRPNPSQGYYSGEHVKIGNPTKSLTLAPLLANPAELAKNLAPDVVILGTDKKERAVGRAAAQKMLRSWTKLGLELGADSREVVTKSYAFAQVSVMFRKPGREKGKELAFPMTALVVAVPQGDGYSVVLAHYAND